MGVPAFACEPGAEHAICMFLRRRFQIQNDAKHEHLPRHALAEHIRNVETRKGFLLLAGPF
jgi:hypothetical protein